MSEIIKDVLLSEATCLYKEETGWAQPISNC